MINNLHLIFTYIKVNPQTFNGLSISAYFYYTIATTTFKTSSPWICKLKSCMLWIVLNLTRPGCPIVQLVRDPQSPHVYIHMLLSLWRYPNCRVYLYAPLNDNVTQTAGLRDSICNYIVTTDYLVCVRLRHHSPLVCGRLFERFKLIWSAQGASVVQW